MALFVAVIALEGIILISLWGLLYQLLKQQGRLLLRLDLVEDRLALVNGEGAEEMQSRSKGLAVGIPFESFHLPDLSAKIVTLEDYAGQRVLLVNWSPHCGFCSRIADDLAALQGELERAKVQFVLAAYGGAVANGKLAEEYGLQCQILLQDDLQSVKEFAGLGTPAAYLIDEKGRVAQRVAVGAYQVPELARKAADQLPSRPLSDDRGLSKSRIERKGLKPGTPAPAFRLPDLHGREVALEDYRGKRVLVVFSDPHCGPCDALAPELVRLHRQHRNNNLAIVMIGRGDPDENRRKVEQFGIEFPVVLQRRWELSKQYGIFATPVGFLVNDAGVIEQEVAQGAESILALAQDRQPAARR